MSTSGNSVTLAPGGGVAAVTINGNVTMDPNDSLAIDINGSVAPGFLYDQLAVNNGVLAAGGATLNATIGYTPSQGDTVTPVIAIGTGSISGAFNYTPTAGFRLSTASANQISLVENRADHGDRR